ncbi:unnamed protein product [Rangifer tarandus platyrhynchus]|uniref:Uncharacterized protein n=1 Tax=Rangifer tarandus platyrhynchus TaxID=3082113 RepID=A0AC59YDS4_RANTA
MDLLSGYSAILTDEQSKAQQQTTNCPIPSTSAAAAAVTSLEGKRRAREPGLAVVSCAPEGPVHSAGASFGPGPELTACTELEGLGWKYGPSEDT